MDRLHGKFWREFKWNGSSRWNVFEKKVIPLEVFPFSRFDRNARKFLTISGSSQNAGSGCLFFSKLYCFNF